MLTGCPAQPLRARAFRIVNLAGRASYRRLPGHLDDSLEAEPDDTARLYLAIATLSWLFVFGLISAVIVDAFH